MKSDNKIISINYAIEKSDTECLKLFCKTKGGLINNTLRRKAWPIILNLDPAYCIADPADLIKKHQYTDQIERDVERSLWKFVSDEERANKRNELSIIINAVLSTCPNLHYFQGYHDIASIFLLISGDELAYYMLRRLSFHHIRDSMNANMDCNMHVMQQLESLLQYIDPELNQYIQQASLPPYYGLSGILTWFSHNIDNLNTVARLFDYFLVSSPYAPLYLSVAILVTNREGIFKVPQDNRLYKHLGGMLSENNNELPYWEDLITKTEQYLVSFPPEKSLDLPPPKSNMKSFPFRDMTDSDVDASKWLKKGSILLIGVFGVVLSAYMMGL